MKTLNTIGLSVIFSVTLFAALGFAQSATTTASGTVLKPLSVSATGLNFGAEIFPGINEVVERTATGAAQFDITGEAGKEITATFTLPTTLAFGENTMPINFYAGDAGLNATNDQAGSIGFHPNDGLTISLEAGGELFIWLGGTVAPASNQPEGAYTTDITLDTAYTSN